MNMLSGGGLGGDQGTRGTSVEGCSNLLTSLQDTRKLCEFCL